jgi:hypothetical protein
VTRACGSASFGTAAGKLGADVTATAVAASRATGGYLILKSNGGVLNFNARWYSSLAGRLTAGVRPTALAAGRSDGCLILTITLALNVGAPAPEVASRAGHSVEILWRVYGGCIDGHEQLWNSHIEEALTTLPDDA